MQGIFDDGCDRSDTRGINITCMTPLDMFLFDSWGPFPCLTSTCFSGVLKASLGGKLVSDIEPTLLVPFSVPMHESRQIIGEVIALSTSLGWSEQEILTMSQARRNLYLAEVGR